MQRNHPHSIWQYTAILLAVLLLLPSGLAFAHNFEDHDHIDRCELSADIHMHENDVDCDLDDIVLKKTNVFAFAKAALVIITPPVYLISSYQPPVYEAAVSQPCLRGPPLD